MAMAEDEKKARKRERHRQWRAKNREKIAANSRRWYEANLEENRKESREKTRRLRQNPKTRDRARAATRRWQAENPEKVAEKSRKYYAANREKVLARCREWEAENRERVNAAMRLRNSTPEGKIEVAIRNATKRIKGRGGAKPDSSIRLLGCTVDEARAHVERQFLPGMSWDNHGKWEIDHVRPISSFDLNDPEQVRACAHYTNLQPLWLADNRAKGARRT